jgi:hypothetical protein
MAFISLDSPSCEVPCWILLSVVYRDVTRQAKELYCLKHEVALKRGLAYLSRCNSGWILLSVVYQDVTRQAKELYRLKHEVALKRGLAYLSRCNSGWFCHRDRFRRGLNTKLKEWLNLVRADNFNELVNMAITQEDCISAHQAEKKRKTPTGPSNMQQPRFRLVQNTATRAPFRNNLPGRWVARPP